MNRANVAQGTPCRIEVTLSGQGYRALDKDGVPSLAKGERAAKAP